MPDFSKLTVELQQDFEANPHIAAVGIFGSVGERETWTRSDIDLFVITTEENDRWEGAYQRRSGVVVHLQTLSLAVLRKNAAVNKGGAFFTALAGVTVWFDRTGDLTKAISTAREFTAPATRLRACREFCPGIEALHLAEKYAVKGKFVDARAALTVALSKLASAALAETGIYPPRDIWASPAAARLPESEEMARVWTVPQTDLTSLIDGVWRRIRPSLSWLSSPILDVIRRDGPLSYNDLADGKRLPGIQLPERLLDELIELGQVVEVERLHEVLGLRETCYEAAERG